MRASRPTPRWTPWLPLLVALLGLGLPRQADAGTVATYRVRMREGSSRLLVSASLPFAGGVLRMDPSRPAGIPELDSLGWSGLVADLRVSDAAGKPLEVGRDGKGGWKLSRTDSTLLRVEYEVDYAPLQRLGWPAPREAAYRDSQNFVLVGRSLFVTTRASQECRVTFELPGGWHATTPWRAQRDAENFIAATPQELQENLVVLSSGPRDDFVSGGFHLYVFAFGHWAAARAEVRRVLGPVVSHHVAMMADTGKAKYVVVLLPALESAAESYRASFALNTDAVPGPATRGAWGNLIAHEMFHLWNGWMLRGADYSSSQWFQEGFTEYAANLAIATSGQVDPDWLADKLAGHIENARRLTTTLENIGNRKGKPLYSAGALVAFAWDVRIREASGGRRDIGDFFRELMRRTDGGKREYTWPDLRAALEATAAGDWEGYYQSFIRGEQRLAVQAELVAVGQRVVEGDGAVRVEADPAATDTARKRWAELLRAR